MLAELAITGLQKKFGGVVAIAGVDMTIGGDGITGVIGPNGSGKTTLFNVVTGVHKPTAGRVTWRGQDITGQPSHKIARLGLVRTFQQAMSYPGLSVIDNVRIGYEHGRALGKERKRWSSSDEVLDFVGLGGMGRAIA